MITRCKSRLLKNFSKYLNDYYGLYAVIKYRCFERCYAKTKLNIIFRTVTIICELITKSGKWFNYKEKFKIRSGV